MLKHTVSFFTSFILVFTFAFSFVTIPAEADTVPPQFIIDEKPFAPPEGEPEPYINKDSRTMVPIRFFAEALGVPNDDSHIGWYQEIQTAVISYEDRVIAVKLGERKITVNGEAVPMDTVAEIRNSRVFIPVRYIAEALDANVQWDNENRTVIIFSKSFLENHRAMQTGRLMDIDNHWIVPAFYEKWKNKLDVSRYDGPEHLQSKIRQARELAAQVKYDIDESAGKVTITLPQFNKKEFLMILNTTQEQVLEPGQPATVYFHQRHVVSHGLFSVTVTDYEFGYIVYSIYGFYKNDQLQFVEGTVALEMLDGD